MPAAGNPSPSAKPPAGRSKLGAQLRGPLLAAAATAVIVFLSAAVAASIVRDHLLQGAEAAFNTRATHIDSDIQRELLLCTQLLRGASGFVMAQLQASGDGTPSSEAWDRYISRLDLDDAPPCVRSLGYAAALPAAGASASSEAEALAHTVLMWPPRGEGTEGSDLGVSGETRAALMRAANSGQVAMSIRPLPRETTSETEAAETQGRARVDLYLPVYRTMPPPALVSARRATLIGFTIARLDAEYLFASVAAHEPRTQLHVSGGEPAMALYPPGVPLGAQFESRPWFQRTDTLRIGGETLTITYATSDPALVASADFSRNAILSSGFAAALVAAAAVFVFMRARGPMLAEAGMARLRSSKDEARLMAIIRSSGEAIITIDED
ncbi:CHASE domain-containing protein, partial [Trinickia sp.]|uniref:CHASE domain-containing protein n=1 Tax=Trinickia sp. TaxID=2571163 RepID=UPI003F7E3D30